MGQATSLPQHLSSDFAQGLVPRESIAQYELGPLRNFVYLVIDWDAKVAVVVDPRSELSPTGDLKAHGLRLAGILLTHSHHDHVDGVPSLLEINPSLPIWLHADDMHRLKRVPSSNLHAVKDGEVLRPFGEGSPVSIEAIHAPGHSAGELCFIVRTTREGYLLSGDTLFIRDCGRTDFATGSDTEMFATLQRLKNLPDELIMLPGHHYARETASLFGAEKKSSPPLLCASVEELRALP